MEAKQFIDMNFLPIKIIFVKLKVFKRSLTLLFIFCKTNTLTQPFLCVYSTLLMEKIHKNTTQSINKLIINI